MEYLEGYDFNLQYHLGKANVVADALGRKHRVTSLFIHEWEIVETINQFGLGLQGVEEKVYLGSMTSRPMLIQKVMDTQNRDSIFDTFTEDSGWVQGDDGGVRFAGRLIVPYDKELQEEILKEAHHIVRFMARCLTCQQVKTEHQRPVGLLQPLPVAQWK
ncbi:uncharacterized protein LOC119981884 [Tripterygium wilfordii]|uniref:uncharacterized protein LOC119981884 n=1 Tax=Tripterygium wilfordii TaxID=458696 RepID=UPI0018F7F68B|nr:uncharacterized protein LOC119981884 [Tripterygium wilfordii]